LLVILPLNSYLILSNKTYLSPECFCTYTGHNKNWYSLLYTVQHICYSRPILGHAEWMMSKLFQSMIAVFVSFSVTWLHAALLCKHSWMDGGPAWSEDSWFPTNIVLDRSPNSRKVQGGNRGTTRMADRIVIVFAPETLGDPISIVIDLIARCLGEEDSMWPLPHYFGHLLRQVTAIPGSQMVFQSRNPVIELRYG